MFELVALLAFIAAPALLGYLVPTYWAALLPAALLIVAVSNYAANPPKGNDETDVLPGAWVLLSALAVVVCLAATALRRRRASSARRQ